MIVQELLERARSQAGRGIRYKLGGGASRASRHTCADADNNCDCSSFVCWALGVDKNGDYPWLRPTGSTPPPGGEWYGTDQIWDDAVNLRLGLFSQIGKPVVGCVIVFPTTWKAGKAQPAGHCGIVTEVGGDGTVKRVIHCSSGNFKAAADAVRETDAGVFVNPRTVLAWCGRIEAQLPQGTVADVGLRAGAGDAEPGLAFAAAVDTAVRFIVVAGGQDEAAIAALAQSIASSNPIGRQVVRRGDPGFPSDSQIAQMTAGTPNPGAVVLRPDGSLFEALNVDDAKNGAIVTSAFAFANGDE